MLTRDERVDDVGWSFLLKGEDRLFGLSVTASADSLLLRLIAPYTTEVLLT